jgi:DNA-binding response OmpR family regulator
MSEKVILVVDDEKEVCNVIKVGLRQLGRYKIVVAHNGKDGLRQAKRVNPDLVLLDVNMPGMDGFQVLELLKSEPQTMHIPVVMLSGRNDQGTKVFASRLYCETYLTKPISLDALENRINAILSRV